MSNMAHNYDDDPQQQELARQFAGKLENFAKAASVFMCPQAIATAMLGVGVGAATASGSTQAAAEWLRGIADELEHATASKH